MSTPSTPDPSGSPVRPRTPTRGVDELERALIRAEISLLEQKSMSAKAAEDFSRVKGDELSRARSRASRLSLAVKALVVIACALVMACASRGRALHDARDALRTCSSDVRALRSASGAEARVGIRGRSGREGSGSGEVKAAERPRTLEACEEALMEARTAGDESAACRARLEAFQKGDKAYFQDANELRKMLEKMKSAMEQKDAALRAVQRRMRWLRACLTLTLGAILACAAHPAVRESFRDLVRASDRRGIEREARADAKEARERSRSESPARASDAPPRPPPHPPTSPSRFRSASTKTRLE